MSNDSVPQEIADAAANPYTDPETLRGIAYQYPQLRPVVALNPSAYPALLEWLAALGDPQVNTALSQRAQAVTAAHSSTPDIPPGPSSAQQATSLYPVQGTPAENDPFPQEKQEKNGSSKPLMGITIFLLILLVIALVVLFFFLSKNHSPVPITNQSNTVVEQSTTTDDLGNSQESNEHSTPDSQQSHKSGVNAPDAPASYSQSIRYPAASNAVKEKYIITPSKNITCALSELGVSCVLDKNNFTQTSEKCTDKEHAIISADEQHSFNGCTNNFKRGGKTLPYGSDAQFSRFACRSQDWGITCWNMYSGKSFAVSRSGYVLSDKGPVPAKNFPWS